MPSDVRLSLAVTPDRGATEDFQLDVVASFLPRPGDRVPLWPPYAGEDTTWEVVGVEWRRESVFMRPTLVLRGMAVTDWGEYRPVGGDGRELRQTLFGGDPRGLLAKAGWSRA